MQTQPQNGVAITVFRLAGQHYGLSIEGIREIVPIMDTQPIPNMPEDWLGVVSIRGLVTPIVDLRTRLSLPRITPLLSAPVIVLRYAGRQVGILVDHIEEIVPHLHRPDEATASGSSITILHQQRMITILDWQTLLKETPKP